MSAARVTGQRDGGREAEDIAIVGMSCLLPGAETPAQLWQNIVGTVDCVGEPPASWRSERYRGPADRVSEPVYTDRGGFIGDLGRFDATKYGIMPSSVEGAEPDQFVALRCAFEVLADAGVPDVPLNTEKTGLIIGRGSYINRGLLTWMNHGYVIDQVVDMLRQVRPGLGDEDLSAIRAEMKASLPPFNAGTVPGLSHCVLAGRIANRLDLKGPFYTLDAACASTLIAVEHGIRELRSGRCDAVIAGGVQVSTPALIYQVFGHIKALSPAGRIAPLSASADGTLLGEGCGMLLLKRRGDAERDGSRIYALIKGVGSSADGRGSGLLAPRTEGQQLAIRRAYEQTGLPPASIGLIEAHATGIPLGDKVELESLRSCFEGPADGPPPIAIGSVKSMIGHSIPAAGVASMIKTALALYHRVLPPTLHADEPNPDLGLAGSPFYLSTTTRPWIHGGDAPRRAGVDAFGFGGINAHAILEEHAPVDEASLTNFEGRWPAELIVVSAADPESLRDRLAALADWVSRAGAVRLLDIAAACAMPGPCRIAIVAASVEELAKKLAHAAKLLGEPGRDKIQDRSGIFYYREPLSRSGRVAFVFPGEGAQYPNMLAGLCRHFPEVRRQFDLTDAALARVSGGPPLSRLIFPPPSEAKAAEAELLQLEGAVVSVTASQRALLALLDRLGIRADAIVGHSSGEFGALLAAGAFRPANEEALVRSIAEGAENATRVVRSGLVPSAVMTAVGNADRGAVEHAMAESGGRLQVAMDNCPNQVILVGDEEATEAAMPTLRAAGGLCERLAWGRAYHTEAYAEASAITEEYYRSLELTTPRIELWSCATAGRFPDEPEAVHKLSVRQWRSPVRFRETVHAMYEHGVRLFIEVGPRGNLSAFISDTLRKQPHAAIPLDLPRRDGIEQLCRAVGMLVAHGVPVDLQALYRRRNPAPLDLSAPPPAAPAPEPVLETALPELKLGAATLAHLRSMDSSSPSPIPEPALPAARPVIPTTPVARPAMPTSTALGPVQPGVGKVAWPKTGRPVEVVIRPPGAPAPERDHHRSVTHRSPELVARLKAAAIADHQRTMQLFLGAQHRVTMSRFATSRAGRRHSSSEAPIEVREAVRPTNGRAHSRSALATVSTPEPPPSVAAPACVPEPPAPVVPMPPPQSIPGASPMPTSSRAVGTMAELERLLVEVASERTGYPPEMLDLDAGLEADLGIDSIKRVELIGAFRRAAIPAAGEPPAAFMEAMTSARSLRAILRGVAELAGSAGQTLNPEAPPSPEVDLPSLPLLQSVLVHDPAHRLIVECELDASRHRFLADHTFFGRSPSAIDPALSTLPVLPLAMSLELMAEAVVRLIPGRTVAAIRNVKTLRWLAFEVAARRVRVEAVALSDFEVEAVLYEADQEGMAGQIAEAVFELAAVTPDLGAPALPEQAAAAPFPRPREELYGAILYHGPAYRGIVAIDACDRHSVRATVRRPDPDLLGPEGRDFVLPVALLDTAGQVSGMAEWLAWSADEIVVTFPNTIDRIELAAGPAPGAELRALASLTHRGNHSVADVEMTTAEGRVVLRTLGRAEELVRLPAGLYATWSSPTAPHMTRDLGGLFRGVPGIEGCTVRAVGNVAGKYLVGRHWRQVLARMILGVEERRAFGASKLPPVPATSWLLGRVAAKDAVRERACLAVPMADVPILSDAHGRPEVSIAGLAAGAAPQVSIAHKEFAAVAAAADPVAFAGVGIDLEPTSPLHSGVIEDAFTPEERAVIEGTAGAGWFPAAWGAKEAVGKALGRGVSGGPRSVEVVAVDPAAGRIALALRGAMAAEFPAYVGATIDAYVREDDGKFITLCLLRRGG